MTGFNFSGLCDKTRRTHKPACFVLLQIFCSYKNNRNLPYIITGHRMFQRQASVCQRNARLTAIAAEENRQALMLFTVVAAFLVCNIPRIVFKLNEVINYESIMRNDEMGCQVKYKLWLHVPTL